MIDVLGFALTFLLAWSGRDMVWTPTFEGAPAQRFEQAMKHYKAKMGIEYDLVFDLHPMERFSGDPRRCSSVEAAWLSAEPPSGFEEAFVSPSRVVLATWWEKGKGCSNQKPEFWALHEACHVRLQHHMGAPSAGERQQLGAKGDELLSDVREHEAAKCMLWYSKKERR